MPFRFRRPRTQIFASLLGIALISALTYVVGTSIAGPIGSADASLVVGGKTYPFMPVTCAVADGDFVASGPGSVAGERYWISASSDQISLALGSDDQLDQPADDQMWLTSFEPVEWDTFDRTEKIVGYAPLRDGRDPDSPVLAGRLSITCPSV